MRPGPDWTIPSFHIARPKDIPALRDHPVDGDSYAETVQDHGPGVCYGVVGRDPRIVEVISLVHKVAASNATAVLLEGETGTGKDLVARAVHLASARKGKPFVEIDCAAIPENLLESELMGHEQGAFTGATSRKTGLFELADGGTVFLNEISELRLDLQVKLLRLVETRTFKRVGGVEEMQVDARIVAATNRDLKVAVGQGCFREDLYYRLNVITIHLPPLRERRKDIPLLADHFVSRLTSQIGNRVRGVSDKACGLLCRYSWPGNVRELRSVVERAAVLGKSDRILARDLPAEIRDPDAASRAPAVLRLTEDGIDLEGLKRGLVRQSLELTGGNQVKAAKLLGIGRMSLRRKMKKYGLCQMFSPQLRKDAGNPARPGSQGR